MNYINTIIQKAVKITCLAVLLFVQFPGIAQIEFKSGYDYSSSSLYPELSYDMYWKCFEINGISTFTELTQQTLKASNGYNGAGAPAPYAKWISPFTGIQIFHAPSEYLMYEINFNVTSSGSSPSLTADFTADNTPTHIFIDNFSSPIWALSGAYSNTQFNTLIHVSNLPVSPLSPGLHKLYVVTYNFGSGSGDNTQSGLIFSGILNSVTGNVEPAVSHSIAGNVWNDVNANGVRSGQFEVSLNNIPLTLYTSTMGYVAGAVTNNFGEYVFSNVVDGSYIVKANPSTTWTQSYPTSNAGYSITVSSSSPPLINNNDFGLYLSCCTSGMVSMDLSTPFNCALSSPTLTYNAVGDCHSAATYTYSVNFGDGSGSSAASGTHTYTTEGTYTFSIVAMPSAGCLPVVYTRTITIYPCTEPCADCVGPFAPQAGDYLIGFWVKEDQASQVAYYSSGATLTFYDASNVQIGSPVNVNPPTSDPIMIEGWQRVEGKFTVPSPAKYMKIELNNASSTVDTYFDDIRIHPFDANMKSFVYDPINLRLMAELDENNFATFYEYDDGGALVRVKKETEKGVMTIKESREKKSVK
jgi:hypothetical protein